MAKTSTQVVDILYSHLKASLLLSSPNKPNGGLYRYQRPQGSQLEDVVINTLPLNRATVQVGVVNVNLFVPNLNLNGDLSQPNTLRLNQLSLLMEQALQETWGTDGSYHFEIQQDNMFQDENNQHYLNCRVVFRALNLKEH